MAKTKTKKRYPVVRHSELGNLDEKGLTATYNMVDVAKHLSEQNHRLYRQSRVYRCKINHLGNPTDRGTVDVFVLRDTWMLQKAYQFAKDQFDKNMTEERDAVSGVNEARWQDFRIVLDPKAADVTEKLPVIRSQATLGGTTLSNGEFQPSLVYKEDGTAMSFGLFSTSVRWSIVEEYDKTADVDSQPSNPVTGSGISAYGGLDNDNHDAARNDLQTRGNAPPYDPTTLSGDKLFRKVATIGSNTGAQRLSTGFFDAPLGLVILSADGITANQDLYELEVQAGDYKGVHGAVYIDANKKFSHRRG